MAGLTIANQADRWGPLATTSIEAPNGRNHATHTTTTSKFFPNRSNHSQVELDRTERQAPSRSARNGHHRPSRARGQQRLHGVCPGPGRGQQESLRPGVTAMFASKVSGGSGAVFGRLRQPAAGLKRLGGGPMMARTIARSPAVCWYPGPARIRCPIFEHVRPAGTSGAREHGVAGAEVRRMAIWEPDLFELMERLAGGFDVVNHRRVR